MFLNPLSDINPFSRRHPRRGRLTGLARSLTRYVLFADSSAARNLEQVWENTRWQYSTGANLDYWVIMPTSMLYWHSNILFFVFINTKVFFLSLLCALNSCLSLSYCKWFDCAGWFGALAVCTRARTACHNSWGIAVLSSNCSLKLEEI